jgi:hypothetical protein
MVSIGLRGLLFTESDLRETAGAAGLSLSGEVAAIARDLGEAFRRFISDARMEQADPASEHLRWANAVAAAAGELARLLGEFDPGDEPDPEVGGLFQLVRSLPATDDILNLRKLALGFCARSGLEVQSGRVALGDYDAVRIAIAAVPVIERAAHLTGAHWARKKGESRMSPYAEPALFGRMCAAFSEAFGREPSFTMPRDEERPKPHGPALVWFRLALLAFLTRAAEAIMEPSSRDDWWRQRCRWLAGEEQAHALAHAIRGGRDRAAVQSE